MGTLSEHKTKVILIEGYFTYFGIRHRSLQKEHENKIHRQIEHWVDAKLMHFWTRKVISITKQPTLLSDVKSTLNKNRFELYQVDVLEYALYVSET